MKIVRPKIDQLDILAVLFDNYRLFYNQKSDLSAAKLFLGDRIRKEDSVIFLALSEDGTALGFTQLYPSYSSVSMQRTYILNDLFVAGSSRKQGVGEALMERAKSFAKVEGSKGLTLETAFDNPARKLYERLGWKEDTAVIHYTWEI